MTKPVKIGLLFATVHFSLFLSFIYYLFTTDLDAQWQLYWIFWTILDFPVSFLMFLNGLFPENWEMIFDNFPYFVHGILGTIWWYFIAKRITEKKIK